MTPNPTDTALEGIRASMAAKLPLRVVQRDLVLDPPNHDPAELEKGVICLVSGGGGRFANYRGREGQLGHVSLGVVGFVKVADDAPVGAVEAAELSLLHDVLDWVRDTGMPRPFDSALPKDWRQSRQLEHPYGWIVLDLDVRPLAT
ncbi:MAG: hypothetical protein M9929_04095 [Burkholderiaceae bacterium]|nr:hypothetical protein [Burkholderiaceae bacterium]